MAATGRIEPFNGSTKISTFVAKIGKISTIVSGNLKLSGETVVKSLIQEKSSVNFSGSLRRMPAQEIVRYCGTIQETGLPDNVLLYRHRQLRCARLAPVAHRLQGIANATWVAIIRLGPDPYRLFLYPFAARNA
jgi:hypothetical protein